MTITVSDEHRTIAISGETLTWMDATEMWFDTLRGLSYILPTNDTLMDAIEDARYEAGQFSETSGPMQEP